VAGICEPPTYFAVATANLNRIQKVTSIYVPITEFHRNPSWCLRHIQFLGERRTSDCEDYRNIHYTITVLENLNCEFSVIITLISLKPCCILWNRCHFV